MKAVNLELLLPADIPAGERILWHGRPQWFSMMRRAFRADYVAAYFGLMTIVNAAMASAAAGPEEAAVSAAKTLGAGALALGLLALLAWLSSRTTLYVITSRRVTMKIGIALPVFFNLPFSSVSGACLRQYSDGTGEIALALGPGAHIAYLHLWPHAKPFRLARPEPALRSVPDSARVAEVLSRALIAASNESHVSAAHPAAPYPTPILYPENAVAAA
jgi:Bacterial PH domain